MVTLLLFFIVVFLIIFSLIISFTIKFGASQSEKIRVATTSSGCAIRDIADISSYRCCVGSSDKYIDFLDLTVSPNPLQSSIELCGGICTEGINPDDPTKCNPSTNSNQLAYKECLSLFKCDGENVIVASSNTIPYYAKEIGRSFDCPTDIECII